jgi:hypothetical protein
MSSGKPVVTTDLPELYPYSDVCYISKTRDEFVANIEKALHEDPQLYQDTRIALARQNDWNDRIRAIEETIVKIFPQVSVIIVTYNNIRFTQLCVESVLAKTGYPHYEIVIVDNASQDGTRDYLRVLATKHKHIRIIFNDHNFGFSKAINLGVKASEGQFIILLNNDTVITRGWINGLLRPLQNPEIGMVGPVTNNCGNESKIKATYRSLEEMEVFAENYTKTHFNVARSMNMLAMFCVALRRETYDQVGPLDEQFEIGMFEDDDYSLRLRQAGFKLLSLDDVFIHHVSGCALSLLPQKTYLTIFNQNKNYFENKWGVQWQEHQLRTDVSSERHYMTYPRTLSLSHLQILRNILNEQKEPLSIIFVSNNAWSVKVFQRYQSLALHFARQGFLTFIYTPYPEIDKVDGFRKIQNHCYLTDQIKMLDDFIEHKCWFYFSTDNSLTYQKVDQIVSENALLVYDYIDKIDYDIAYIAEHKLRSHELIIKDERIAVACSADILFQKVAAHRQNRFALVTNGVDINHFSQSFDSRDIPESLQPLVNKKKPIIGYFGSLATWFDYELTIELALSRKEYEILLIGYNYDNSLHRYNLKKYSNITLLDPVDYQILPRYAHVFDVAMIPFRLNSITEATSPIKLFEYMAMNCPVVTTDMPECRKYRSVLIGKSPQAFIQMVDKALTLKDDSAYLRLLKQEALENSWDKKVEQMLQLIDQSKGYAQQKKHEALVDFHHAQYFSETVLNKQTEWLNVPFGSTLTLLSVTPLKTTVKPKEFLEFEILWRFQSPLPTGKTIAYYIGNKKYPLAAFLDLSIVGKDGRLFKDVMARENVLDFIKIKIPDSVVPGVYEVSTFIYPTNGYELPVKFYSQTHERQKTLFRFKVI